MTVPLTNIPKSHTTKKSYVIKEDTQTDERSKTIVISESYIPPTQQKTLYSKTTIRAIAIGICFLAIVIGSVFTNFVGKGGELVTIYNSFKLQVSYKMRYILLYVENNYNINYHFVNRKCCYTTYSKK